jgi:hypothetical protein
VLSLGALLYAEFMARARRVRALLDDVVSVPGEVWGPVFAVPVDGIAGELVGGFLECGVLAGFTADSYVACVGDVDVAVLEKFAAAQEAGRQAGCSPTGGALREWPGCGA